MGSRMGRRGRGEHMERRGEMTGAKDRRERQRRVREGGVGARVRAGGGGAWVGGACARVGERRTRARGECTFTVMKSSTRKILLSLLFMSRD
jgi:hypothetical protein